jgi:hypothetical protein
VLVEAHDEWQTGDRRSLAEGSMALLTDRGPGWPRPQYRADGEPPPPLGLKAGMEKSHLLARRFGGAAILENIVPMYWRANASGMAREESTVRQLLAVDSRVYFLARPMYPTKNHSLYKQLGEAPILVMFFYATKRMSIGPHAVLNTSG